MTDPVLRVKVPGNPVGKRAKEVDGRGTRPRLYTPDDGPAWEKQAADLFGVAWYGLGPLEGPVAVTIRAVKARPKKLLAKKYPDKRFWRIRKPDLDNVKKCVHDALETAGVVINDAQVCANPNSGSLWVARGEEPCVEVELRVIEGAWG